MTMSELKEITREEFALAYLGEVGMRRFLAKVGVPDGPGGCAPWMARVNQKGYGLFDVTSPKAEWRPGVPKLATMRAHRIAWAHFTGDACPSDMQIDHKCRNRRCLNPSHLRVVTNFENQHASPYTLASIYLARTHCLQGHAYDDVNTLKRSNGGRRCRECKRARDRAQYARKRLERNP